MKSTGRPHEHLENVFITFEEGHKVHWTSMVRRSQDKDVHKTSVGTDMCLGLKSIVPRGVVLRTSESCLN